MMIEVKQPLRLAGACAMVLVLCLAFGAHPALAKDACAADGDEGRFCSRTAALALAACRNQVQDDAHLADAICLNISATEERRACYEDAKAAQKEESQLCREQHAARLEVCEAIGEARYDPDYDAEDFLNDLDAFANQNPFLPLQVGNRWSYAGGDETIEIEVLGETKLIDGLTCIVVNDRVWEDGELVEDTDDWMAQAATVNGDVVYCGEEVKDFETFEGDSPALPELVAIDGAFKAGRDGDKAGLLFPGMPEVGQIYRQEFSLGNAEDVAEVLSTNYHYGADPDLDTFVPQALAELFCVADNDCVVTREFSPLEPDVVELKYFARGVGLFLEVNPEDEETVQLVGCNVDPRCGALSPAP